MTTNYTIQILILDEEKHQNYLETFVEEPLDFEEFINFMLATLYDNNQIVKKVIPIRNAKAFIIVYAVPVT